VQQLEMKVLDIVGALHGVIMKFISDHLSLRMRNVPDKSCKENQNPHFVFSDHFFSPKIVLFIK